MSTQHTPGRLVLKVNGEANSYALLDESGAWWLSVLLNGQQLTAMQEANLRRLAACWNACEGATTEQAEELAGISGISGLWLCLKEVRANNRQLRADARAIEANYEAARALLTETLAYDDEVLADMQALGMVYKLPADAVELTERIRAFLKGGA